MSVYAEDIKCDGITIMPSAYLATSQLQILDDVDLGQIETPCDIEAMIPEWLIVSKIEQYKNDQKLASKAQVQNIIDLATS